MSSVLAAEQVLFKLLALCDQANYLNRAAMTKTVTMPLENLYPMEMLATPLGNKMNGDDDGSNESHSILLIGQLLHVTKIKQFTVYKAL